jgi:intracellular multiplication protein IcmO
MATQPKRFVHGLENAQELDPSIGNRDIRSTKEKIAAFIFSPEGLISVAAMTVFVMVLMPSLMEIAVLTGGFIFYLASKRQYRLPFRLPASAVMPDPSTPREAPGKIKNPGESKTLKASAGIAFLGNDRRTREELWLSDDDMRTHMLVVGSTGAGKALKDSELIHTPDGWRRMDTLSVGDRVSTPDGKTTRVSGVFPQGNLALWRVTFDDGRTLDVSAEHLWEVHAWKFSGPLMASGLVSPFAGELAFARNPAPAGEGHSSESQVFENRAVANQDTSHEVIDTVTLQRRLELHEWEDGAAGLAIPLTRALDTESQGLPVRADELVAAWRLGRSMPLAGTAAGAFDGSEALSLELVLGAASLAERQQLWTLVLDGFDALHVGNMTSIEIPSTARPEPIVALARSLGWWAKSELVTGLHRVVVRHADTTLRVRWVEKLEESVSCRCIKLEDSRGLFVARDWTVTHNTETLISMAYNALVQGSGFIYVDGKGDSGLWAKIFSICRTLGREDDLLVINYMKGGRDVFGPQKTRLSNTINPFVSGSSGGLTELVVGLMDESGGDNAMWKGRAISLISAIMMALCWDRDNMGKLLDVEVIRDHLLLENIQKLSKRRDMPANIIQSIRAYLRSLPGYVDHPPNATNQKQSETVLDQHGYLQMQFTKIMGSLADTYGYIFKTNVGEVDFFDVVIQRRILVVLLPALENSPDELSNLGKIIVANLKQMMAATLGDILEGDYKDIIESKPTTSPSPYMVILDEYGYYVVKGAAVMPAQARSLGFCMIFAGQDYPSFKKNNNAEEAAATIGNCNVKIFMKVEDPTDTYDLALKTGGEGVSGKTSGYSLNQGGLFNRYFDAQNASLERRNRVDLRDLQSQKPGEAHIFFQSTLIRAQMFYAQPPKAPQMQINHFLRVTPPSRQEMKDYDIAVSDILENLMDEETMTETLEMTERVTRIEAARCTFNWLTDNNDSAMRAAMGAIVAVQKSSGLQMENMLDDANSLMEDDEFDREVNVFGHRGDLFDLNEEDIPDEDGNGTGGMFLDEKVTFENIRKIETISGRSPSEASRLGQQATEEMKKVSGYPSTHIDEMPLAELQSIINGLGEEDPENGE